MSLRGLVIAIVVLSALGLAWQKRDQLQAWAGRAPTLATVVPGLDAPAGGDAARKPGGLRKCVKGQEVSYTNVECPPGHREQAVTAAPVNVLPATPVSKPAEAGSGPSALHKALDITRDETLQQKAIERAIDGATR